MDPKGPPDAYKIGGIPVLILRGRPAMAFVVPGLGLDDMPKNRRIMINANAQAFEFATRRTQFVADHLHLFRDLVAPGTLGPGEGHNEIVVSDLQRCHVQRVTPLL